MKKKRQYKAQTKQKLEKKQKEKKKSITKQHETKRNKPNRTKQIYMDDFSETLIKKVYQRKSK